MALALTDFQYDLPPDQIAQTPAHPRDHARLMKIDRKTNTISHHYFYDLPSLLPSNYHLIANNTKVFPARLIGQKISGGKVELLLLKKLPHSCYEVIASPGLSVGQVVVFPPSLSAKVVRVEDRVRTVEFSQHDPELTESLSTLGTMPTPPYIKKMIADNSEYQTIYAKYGFSAAAPTAGLHFTPELLKIVKDRYGWSELTLDVGLGTFLPVKVEDLSTHHMHSEHYRISPSLATHLNTLSSPLCVVGTTTMRALESNAALTDSRIHGKTDLRVNPGSFATDIFIYPPYQFRMTDALITNFHLPGSTLLMLVSAFCSSPNSNEQFTTFADSLLGRAYAEAIRENYRFFSFGDAMLII